MDYFGMKRVKFVNFLRLEKKNVLYLGQILAPKVRTNILDPQTRPDKRGIVNITKLELSH